MKKLYTHTQSIFSMKHIWKVLLFFIIFCSAQKAEAQFRQVSAFKDTVGAVTVFNDTIYIATYPEIDNVKVHDTVRILKWMGKTWDTVAFLPYYDDNYQGWYANFLVTNLSFIQGEMYLLGNFDSLPGLAGKTKFLKWNGNNWTIITQLPFTQRQDEIAHRTSIWNNELWTTNNYLDKVASWNGTLWTQRDSFSKEVLKVGSIYSMDTSNNELFIYGNFRVKDGSAEKEISSLKWNGSFWEPAEYSSAITMQQNYKDGVIIYKPWSIFSNANPSDTVYYATATDTIPLTEGYNINGNLDYGNIHSTVVIKDKIYRFGWVREKSTQIYFAGLIWDGTKWDFIPKHVESYTRLNKSLYMRALKTKTQALLMTATQDSSFFFHFGDFARITGNVFHDINGNCKKDADELPVNNAIIEIKPGPIYINTNDSGNYSIITDSGQYALKIIPRKYWGQTCPGNDSALIVNTFYDSVHTNNNLALSPIANVNDVRTTLTGSLGWRARQGFTESYTLCYENAGTTTASGKIKLLIDSSFIYFSSTPKVSAYTYPFAEWEFDSLKPDEKRCITFKVKASNARVNDSIQLTAYFDGGNNWIDSSETDNFDTLKQRVVAAVDPNDKTSKPAGNITQETKELRYQIRFQNTGTDTAYRVTVIDTVDTNLPLTKIMMNSSSHKYKLSIKNNVFTWTFEGIMLPDSNTNEPLSHGFINYTAQIKQGLALGTEIKNTAYIYFDYQKPVITNTARSKVVKVVPRIGRNKFTGKVYYDINNNCVRDENEPPVKNAFISISPGKLAIINTDENGNYTFFADSGTYTLKAIPAKYWNQTCPANNSAAVVYTLENKTYVNDFGLQPMPNIQDVRVSLTGAKGWQIRSGVAETFTLVYENVGTTIASGKISVLDSGFSVFSATPNHNYYIYNRAFWDFDSLQVGEKRIITLHVKSDSARIGDSVKITAAIDGGINWMDKNATNNTDTLHLTVEDSIFSNNKNVFPAGDFTARTKELRYQIRFRNTGNDVVRNVIIVDTLDQNLPLTKVITESASHPYTLDVKNNVYTWTFNNVMLPSGNTNDSLSQGFLTYTAEIKPGITLHTKIKNTAHIYYDSQPAFATNTTTNRLVEEKIIEEPDGLEDEQSISSQLLIYPNPASSYLYIKNDGNIAKELQIVNILGQVLSSVKVQPFEIRQLNIEHLQSGIYFIRTNGKATQKLIIE